MTRTTYGDYGSSLRDLPRLRSSRRARASSWDRTGGNADYVVIAPGETAVLADIAGAGSIEHIWMTLSMRDSPNGPRDVSEALRALVLRMHWDGAAEPSVLTPLGDFFGVGHGQTVNFASLPLQMSPQDGRGFNCFFHMPFAAGARVEVTNELPAHSVNLYFYVDYARFDALDADVGRFHAHFRRENPTDGVPQGTQTNDELLFEGVNLSDAGNYVVLETEGRGHYVGCVLSIRNLRETDEHNWYGEGDDMIIVDGEPFPPAIHGTGTEDYFNTAFCPSQAYAAPYHGITLPGGPNWSGEISLYRFHVEDPIPFERSIRVSIEHGHANKRSDDCSSVAYWYQAAPHPGLRIPPLAERLP
jgi:hypothetical protein